jgi:predicted transcriptional regulator
MQASPRKLSELLPHGAQQKIATELGITRAAVGDALRRGKPGNPAVIMALRMARESGALTTAQDIDSLTPQSEG